MKFWMVRVETECCTGNPETPVELMAFQALVAAETAEQAVATAGQDIPSWNGPPDGWGKASAIEVVVPIGPSVVLVGQITGCPNIIERIGRLEVT